MRTSRAFHCTILVFGLAAMLASTGCATKRRATAGTPAPDEFGAGDVLTGGFTEGGLPMPGESFTTLPPAGSATFAPVYFGYDNYQIPASEYSKIDQVAEFLRSNPATVLVIEGHCDERGSSEYNMSLGEYRAQSLRSYLVSAGIAPERIQTVSYGEEKPAALGTGEDVWRQNRRGEFAMYQR